MKFFFLLIVAVACSQSVSFSQTAVNKFSAQLTFGPNMPMGDFGSSSPSNQKAGYAKAGWALDALIEYRISRRFRIFLLGGIGQNPFDKAAQLNFFQSVLTPGDAFHITSSSPWKIGKLMAGKVSKIMKLGEMGDW